MDYHCFVFSELDLIWRCRDGTLRSGVCVYAYGMCVCVWVRVRVRVRVRERVRVRWRVRVRVCVRVCVSVSVFPMDLHCDAVFSDCECDILVLVPDNSSVMSICQQRP